MRKTYECPSLGLNGSVVSQTQNGPVFGNELAQPLMKRNITTG